ncbi:hypothetical protein BGZ82_002761 [Podila clonocystis]|nr:hypothetical protein BGZ82_002761 [Podila clonocystis]
MTSIELECLTTDGTYLYGFSQPDYSDYALGSVIALIRSNPNPNSATTITWTLLNAIDASDHVFLRGRLRCTIDDKGVFSVFCPKSRKTKFYYEPDSLGPKGLQFTPGSSNTRNDTRGSMSGIWTTFNLTEYDRPYAINAVFNYKDGTGINTLMHAVVNTTSSENIFLSTMNREQTSLDPNTSGDSYMSLGYANGNLYVFGRGWHTASRARINAMTIIPITSTSTYIPNNRTYTVLNATLAYSSCGSLVGFRNVNLGKDLVINCWAYFLYYDGTSIRELGSSDNTDMSEILSMVPIGTIASFEIFMISRSPNGVKINSMRLINDGTPRRNITRSSGTLITIPEKFALTPPPTPTLTNSGSSSDGVGGLGARAIIGILAALLIALGGLVAWVRRSKVSAQNAAVMATSQTKIRPHCQENEPTHGIKTYTATGPDGQHPATSVQGGPTPLAGQTSFAQQQQIYPAISPPSQPGNPLAYAQPPQPQPYQLPQHQFVFSTHPRPTVASVMDPDNPIMQQQPPPPPPPPQPPQPQHYYQVSQGWQPQPFVPPNQVPIPQEAPPLHLHQIPLTILCRHSHLDPSF